MFKFRSLVLELVQFGLAQLVLEENVHYEKDLFQLDEDLFASLLEHALAFGIETGHQVLDLHIEQKVLMLQSPKKLQKPSKIQYPLGLIPLIVLNMEDNRLYHLRGFVLSDLLEPVFVLKEGVRNDIKRVIDSGAFLGLLIGQIDLIYQLHDRQFRQTVPFIHLFDLVQLLEENSRLLCIWVVPSDFSVPNLEFWRFRDR